MLIEAVMMIDAAEMMFEKEENGEKETVVEPIKEGSWADGDRFIYRHA